MLPTIGTNKTLKRDSYNASSAEKSSKIFSHVQLAASPSKDVYGLAQTKVSIAKYNYSSGSKAQVTGH